jgi:hypothetical protein
MARNANVAEFQQILSRLNTLGFNGAFRASRKMEENYVWSTFIDRRDNSVPFYIYRDVDPQMRAVRNLVEDLHERKARFDKVMAAIEANHNDEVDRLLEEYDFLYDVNLEPVQAMALTLEGEWIEGALWSSLQMENALRGNNL